jgi:hypothetical protein
MRLLFSSHVHGFGQAHGYSTVLLKDGTFDLGALAGDLTTFPSEGTLESAAAQMLRTGWDGSTAGGWGAESRAARRSDGADAAQPHGADRRVPRVLRVHGRVPREVVDGKVTILPSKFGDFDEGLLNVSRVKTGQVTLARPTASGDRYTMHVVTGNATRHRARR